MASRRRSDRDLGPIDARKIRTYPLASRTSKFTRAHYGRPHRPGGSVRELLDSLPRVLAADDLRALARAVAGARRRGRPVIVGIGAHVIKTGLSPVLIDLIERDVITALAMNGAGIVHDAELAMVGHTSEDVDATLAGGGFGGAKETAEVLNAAIASTAPARRAGIDGAPRGTGRPAHAARGGSAPVGLGRAVGEHLLERRFPFVAESLLATCARRKVPCTVHVAVGTDIFHMHPDTDGALLGAASMLDFRIFAEAVRHLSGGVYLNVGSAVILPEVFLKAVSLCRNLGTYLDDVTTANFDFIRGYRPLTNVVNRPTGGSGRGYNLVGHHEILIPLFAAAVVEELEDQRRASWRRS